MRARRSHLVAMLVGLAGGMSALATLAQPDPAVPAESSHADQAAYFKGSVPLPNGVDLDFTVRLVRALDGAPSGTIDIPLQGVKDFALSDVVWTSERLAFTMEIPGVGENVWPKFDYAITPGAGPQKGSLDQAGMHLETTIEALADAPVAPRRPQEPVAPFPYEIRDVSFENPGASLTIGGTLTIPEGDGPFPCAVMITGSGAQNRDEELMGHRPFLVIADYLSRHGIAVLRCDDRGVGATGLGTPQQPDSTDFATDVRAALTFLEAQPEIDVSRLGLIGHSEGGLIGPMVAAEDARVSFLVMLAGPGVPGDEILVRQSAAMALAMGADPEQVEAQGKIREALFAELKDGQTEAAEAHLRQLVEAEMEGATPEVVDASVQNQLRIMGSRWMRTFMSYDPRPTLRRVSCPVLVLNGDKDMQVLQDQNVPEVVRALNEGGNHDVSVHVLPGLNHLFQPATTGAITEYATIETTFSPEALRIMGEWINQQTSAAR